MEGAPLPTGIERHHRSVVISADNGAPSFGQYHSEAQTGILAQISLLSERPPMFHLVGYQLCRKVTRLHLVVTGTA